MKITIREKQYTLKYTLRSLFVFEKLSGKAFAIKTLTDEYIYFYSILIANNPDMDITFEELIDELDANPSIMQDYQKFISNEFKVQGQFKGEEEDKDGKKKA